MTQIVYRIEKGPRDNLEDAGRVIILKRCVRGGREILVLVVADGVGGALGGEVASSTTVWWLVAHISASLASPSPNESCILTSEGILTLLVAAIGLANQALLQKANGNPDLKGMASTVVSAVVVNGILHVAWLGDSRAYLFRDATLRRISRDHSHIQDLLDAEVISPEEAKEHPCAHVIHRYLGHPGPLEVETRLHQLLPSDLILLCTDGLTDVVSDEQIAELLRDWDANRYSIELLPKRLTERSLREGTQDNVTVMCCHYQPTSKPLPEKSDQTCTGSYPVERAKVLRQLTGDPT
jgi:protein phosphatase